MPVAPNDDPGPYGSLADIPVRRGGGVRNGAVYTSSGEGRWGANYQRGARGYYARPAVIIVSSHARSVVRKHTAHHDSRGAN